jgi:hypothetical protein
VKRYGKYGGKASRIVKRYGYHYSTYFSSIFTISFQNFLLYFPYLFTIQLTFLPYLPYHFTIFFCIFQIFSLFNLLLKMRKKIVKWYGKYRRKVSWIVKWYGKYVRKVSWIVKRFGKYEMWNDILGFLPYFPYLFTLQLIFLLCFPNIITIQLSFLPYFTYL